MQLRKLRSVRPVLGEKTAQLEARTEAADRETAEQLKAEQAALHQRYQGWVAERARQMEEELAQRIAALELQFRQKDLDREEQHQKLVAGSIEPLRRKEAELKGRELELASLETKLRTEAVQKAQELDAHDKETLTALSLLLDQETQAEELYGVLRALAEHYEPGREQIRLMTRMAELAGGATGQHA